VYESFNNLNVNNMKNKTLVWPHDVESFQGSTFCLMVQSWNIWVCRIDQVFVTELSVVILFCSYSRFEYKNSISFGKNTFIIPYYSIDSMKSHFLVVHVVIVLGDWNIYPVCFQNICWHSWLNDQLKFV
jgi:hypothetical protein